MSRVVFVVFLLAFQVCCLEARNTLTDRVSSLQSTLRAGGSCEWDYSDFCQWGKCNYDCGTETNQAKGSPINIDTTSGSLTPNTFQLSSAPDGGNLIADAYKQKYTSGNLAGKWARKGFTLQFTINDNVATANVPTVKYNSGSSNTLSDSTHNYKLSQVHYHWGKSSSEGSEHTIDNSAAPLEAHFVHVNQDVPDSDPNSLLVIGVLYETSAVENTKTNWIKWPAQLARDIARDELMAPNKDTDGVTPLGADNMPITIAKNTHWHFWFTLKEALKDGHYAYKGSLTTPGCNEQVTWIVAKNKVPIYEPHLDYFRKLVEPRTGELVRRNWRPTQTGVRTVYSMATSWVA